MCCWATFGTAATSDKGRAMTFYFLVEDLSGERLIEQIMKKYIAEMPEYPVEYCIRSYKGIGGLKRGRDVQNIKSQQLLNDLPKRLSAYQAELQYFPDTSLFIVLDNDDRDVNRFRAQLEALAAERGITIDHVFCIAVEEMEAWLLGDLHALQKAYPQQADRIFGKIAAYRQDSICGTWEFLADILTTGGLSQFRKENPSGHAVGQKKSEWAVRIGEQLQLRANCSPSFQAFLGELDCRRQRMAERLSRQRTISETDELP